MTAKKRVAILISGRGSNMTALVEAARDPNYPAEIVGVFSNNPEAAGIARAASEGIATAALSHKAYASKAEFEAAMDAVLDSWRTDIVCLAGFMRVLTPWFVNAWEGRLLNIHPSLLPKYPGVDTHERALAAGDAVHGCSVHFVTAGVDEGPLIGQAEVDVKPGDTADTLAARVLKAEHLLYPRCVAAVASGWDGLNQFERIDVDGDIVRMMVPR